MASLVVCNGGAPAAYAALTSGVPILAIVTNLDQILNMRSLGATGASITLRGRPDSATISKDANRLLEDGRFATAARAARDIIANFNVTERTSMWLKQLD